MPRAKKLDKQVDKTQIIKDKLSKGEITAKELILDALPKDKEKEFVYIDKEVPVIKEVRVIKDGKDTDVTEIIKKELDLVDVWEYKQIPISEMSLSKLQEFGKDGWKFIFSLSPDEVHGAKTTQFYFQKPKKFK